MSRPCTVCAHSRRAEIDQRLAFQVVNVSEIAREYKLSRDAVRSHRERHLPAFLAAFQASADALTLGVLQAEAQRLYRVTLDALASAEAAVLDEVEHPDRRHPRVSHTNVARLIKEARAGLGLLAKLSADAGETDSAPSGVANGELDARIATALDAVMSRALNAAKSDPPLVAMQPSAY